VNARSRRLAASSRPSIAFIVRASRAISSSPAGSGTRRSSSPAEMAVTSARIASTGRRARPTTSQVTTPISSPTSGTPTSSSRRSVPTVSETSSRLVAT
jgi:hypothetical protein